MTDQVFISKWYVLHTKSRFESVVEEGLLKKSKEVFLPKITVKSKRKDRRKLLRVPLFPGYMFVKSDLSPAMHVDILKTHGVVKVVGNHEGPVDVPDHAIESLKIMVQCEKEIFTGTQYNEGDIVLVIHGPFTGVTGVFARYSGKGRVVVNVDALGQSAAVEVDEEDIERVPDILK